MKKYALLSLPLAFALTLPAIAQTPSNSNANAPAAQSSSQDQNQATPAPADNSAQSSSNQSATSQNATGHEPLTIETRQGFWGKINPFARKKYVQRQLSPIKDRVNELDELTAKNSQMIKDVDSRAQEGIKMASNKANEADQHAVDAGNRAQLANQTATQANTRLQNVSTVVGNIDQYQPASQVEIRFRPGQAVLSKKAKDALDEMASPLKDSKGYIIEVQGFSAGRGQAAIANSQQMAQAVVRYLVLNHEVPVYRIYTLGMGNAPMPANAEGKRPKRINGGRVEISLLKNGVDQLASQMNETSATPSSTPSNQGGVSGTAAQPNQTQPSQQQNQSAPQTAQPSSNTTPQSQPQSDVPHR
jgi:outer membrane protein OmpA-like peptidoglycan-associated protein